MLQEPAFPLRRLNSRVETRWVWSLSCDDVTNLPSSGFELGGLCRDGKSKGRSAMTALDSLSKRTDQRRRRSAALNPVMAWPPVHGHEMEIVHIWPPC